MTITAELHPDSPFSLSAAAAFAFGPAYATLVLLRATGVTDVLTLTEPRLPEYVAHFYGTGPGPATPEELTQVAESWRPFRTWAAVLIRAAGDRAGLTVPAAA